MKNKKSMTISVTLPVQLEDVIKKEAKLLGISRSRMVSNILLEWQQQRRKYVPSE